jgi:hypothetical protein
MTERVAGWFVLISGWVAYVVALTCPAIEFSAPGLDMGPWHETKFGVICLADTMNPFNWIFAPPLPVYLVGNLVMLACPLIVGCWPPARAAWGVLLLVAFLYVSAPRCVRRKSRVPWWVPTSG